MAKICQNFKFCPTLRAQPHHTLHCMTVPPGPTVIHLHHSPAPQHSLHLQLRRSQLPRPPPPLRSPSPKRHAHLIGGATPLVVARRAGARPACVNTGTEGDAPRRAASRGPPRVGDPPPRARPRPRRSPPARRRPRRWRNCRRRAPWRGLDGADASGLGLRGRTSSTGPRGRAA